MNKSLPFKKIKTRTAMNAKILVLVFCVEEIIYLPLYNLHDCTFEVQLHQVSSLWDMKNRF